MKFVAAHFYSPNSFDQYFTKNALFINFFEGVLIIMA